MKQWYEELFENYGEGYDQESFTTGTLGECDFIEAELEYDRDRSILDIGCGTGRHAVELASRGYRVTGIDLSASQLARAVEKAKLSGVEVAFLRRDAREPFGCEAYDAAVMLCEGSFPLMETDSMNYAILCNACAALKPGGRFIFTTLNGLFPLYHSVKDFLNAENGAAITSYDVLGFDLMTFRERGTVEFTDDSGRKRILSSNERYYVPPEISWLLQSAGFAEVTICGARLGAFSREDPLTVDDYEMLVIADKAQ